ncbi:type I methionyl aminopeptidase [Candidatus Saccharibacteria bacterium]|nr:type I methionyl aminopeptidase [Candidatus Saccharibacteria bacterium]
MYTRIKTSKEIEAMRSSGKILAQVLGTVERASAVGVSTKYLADLAASELKTLGGKPPFLGYGDVHNAFPDVICISVNDAVVHGIPSSYELRSGDIVSIDFGVNYDGMITDAARTFCVDGTSNELKKLIKDTERSMYAGIDALKNGVRVGDVSSAIQKVLVAGGYGIVRDLVGHGVGHELHEEPDIPNYGFAGRGDVLKAGMTIAIEPMATMGGHGVYVDDDGWTIKTTDGSLAAHFENTVLITDKGYEILTV